MPPSARRSREIDSPSTRKTLMSPLIYLYPFLSLSPGLFPFGRWTGIGRKRILEAAPAPAAAAADGSAAALRRRSRGPWPSTAPPDSAWKRESEGKEGGKTGDWRDRAMESVDEGMWSSSRAASSPAQPRPGESWRGISLS